MSDRSYWLDLFTGTTWNEFLKSGGQVSGFRERRWKTVRQIKPGDYLLCYLIGVMRFIGILEVVSEPYRDKTKIWEDDVFPCRVKVKIVANLAPQTAVPLMILRDKLTLFQNIKNPHGWTGRFRHSPTQFSSDDGEVIVKNIIEAKGNPVVRPFNEAKLAYRPRDIEGE